MIKVARFIPFFSGEAGGPVRHILELTKHLVKYPIETIVYTSSDINESATKKTFQFHKINPTFVIKRFNSYIRFRDYRISLGMFRTLLKDSKNIDIFHSHGFRSFQEDVASISAILKKKQLIITTHGALCVNINYFDHLYKRLYDIIDTSLKNKFLDIHYIAVAKLEIDFLKRYGISDENIHYIPHGIDFNYFKPSDPEELIKKYNLSHLKNKKIILYVGRIAKRKGIDILIKAFSLLKKELKDAYLLIAGGDFDYKSKILNIANKEHLKNRIIFLGHVPKRFLPKVYSLANVVVYPSKFEIFGHVILEANACKKPVIASNHWGPKELIINGKTGFLTKYNDIEQLKEKIVYILNNEDLQRKMGKFTRNYVKKNFSWEKNASEHYKIYKSILNM
ncbi:MAG: glycosyltransferase family 4 protein [Promethearchaeota archaeon]